MDSHIFFTADQQSKNQYLYLFLEDFIIENSIIQAKTLRRYINKKTLAYL